MKVEHLSWTISINNPESPEVIKTTRVKPTKTIHVFQKKILVWSGPFVYSSNTYPVWNIYICRAPDMLRICVFYAMKTSKTHVLSDQSVHITHAYCCVSKLSKFEHVFYSLQLMAKYRMWELWICYSCSVRWLTAIGWFIISIQSDLFWHRCLERQAIGTPRMYTLSPSKSIKWSNYKYAPNLESLLTQQYACVMCTLWSDNTCVLLVFIT
jgi:hypothetical protein